MTGTTTIQTASAQRAVQPIAGDGTRRRLRSRHLWIVAGLAIAIFANELGKTNGVGILTLIAFGIAPDLPRLLGIRGRDLTGVRTIALGAFNVLHHPVAPTVAVAVTATGVVPPIWLVGSLVWLSHVVIGRGVGDVPRWGGDRPDA
jgi:hypothetical protein